MTILEATPGWPNSVPVDPGVHVGILVTASGELSSICLAGRLAGLHLRDTLLVLRPGPTISFILLFRRPLVQDTLVEQVVSTGAGALDIEKSRPGLGRWPTNVLVLHGPGCHQNGSRKLGYSTGSRERRQSNRSRPSLGFYEPGTKRRRVVHLETVLVPHFNYGDQEGVETVDDWACQPGCCVPLLGVDQSRYYPQFVDEEGLRAWLARLIAPVPIRP